MTKLIVAFRNFAKSA